MCFGVDAQMSIQSWPISFSFSVRSSGGSDAASAAIAAAAASAAAPSAASAADVSVVLAVALVVVVATALAAVARTCVAAGFSSAAFAASFLCTASASSNDLKREPRRDSAAGVSTATALVHFRLASGYKALAEAAAAAVRTAGCSSSGVRGGTKDEMYVS